MHIRNPRTGQFDAVLEISSANRVSATAARLRAAQPGWAELSVADRAARLRQLRDSIAGAGEAICAALAEDTGRVQESALEFAAVPAMLERWSAEDALEPLVARHAKSTTPHIDITQRLVPYPLVGVIAPWNAPLLLSLIDAVPALAAGSAVLIKPSELTPRFVAPLAAAIAASGAIGEVIAWAQGAAGTGQAVVGASDLICFTGSVATGRAIAAAAAARLIPAFLELGGKDAAVVLPGADIDRATTAILWASVNNTGQACQSIERVYVHASLHDAFVAELIRKAERVTLSCDAPDGDLGPIISEPQAAKIVDQVDEALTRGARLAHGGKLIEQGGLWMAPTVLLDVDHAMTVMQEETFGPVLPVMAYATEDEARRLANDSIYGLSAAVFGPPRAARAFAATLEAGAVSINDAGLTAIVHDAEKMAFKQSGLGGSRMGAGALLRFVRKQALLANSAPAQETDYFGKLAAGRVRWRKDVETP